MNPARAHHLRPAPALLGYLAVRLLAVAVLGVWAARSGHGLWTELTGRWDSLWYRSIATGGYDTAAAVGDGYTNLAFFPLYPGLTRFADQLLPGSAAGAGLAVSVLASLLAAWGIFAVGELLYGRRAGVVLTLLWAVGPVAVIQWTNYTESLFTALAAWALYAVLTGRWLWAGVLALLGGLTRPTGIAIAAAVSVTAVLAVLRRRAGRRAAVAAVIAPLGWVGFIGWVGWRVGRWDGYFSVQRAWSSQWDFGAKTARSAWASLTGAGPSAYLIVVTAVLVLSLVLYALSLAQRQPLPLLVFSGVLLLLVLGDGGYYAPRARFLMPAFPLLLPLATAVAARPRAAALAIAPAALGSAALGGYLMFVYPGAP
ncbi:glycosyltransferase family 39 protein [Streptomyces sp. TP-A0874]|uniref:glycosyltransferase family 39 protein n=1 Tax=Streptomyces sp. TP-A0874 TaxID=549819 RepID=UPI000853E7EC|nr:glycosyltransferase family 39 protein [Streptomyces sp. TP-A0874]